MNPAIDAWGTFFRLSAGILFFANVHHCSFFCAKNTLEITKLHWLSRFSLLWVLPLQMLWKMPSKHRDLYNNKKSDTYLFNVNSTCSEKCKWILERKTGFLHPSFAFDGSEHHGNRKSKCATTITGMRLRYDFAGKNKFHRNYPFLVPISQMWPFLVGFDDLDK